MNILQIGFGTIARAFNSLEMPFDKIIIVDKEPLSDLIEQFFADKDKIYSKKTNYEFIQLKVIDTTVHQISELIQKHNIKIVIDCSYNIDTLELISQLRPGVGFINTSVENWEHTYVPTLKERQEQISKWYAVENKGANPIVLDCGMNPGLISLWAYDCFHKHSVKCGAPEQPYFSTVGIEKVIQTIVSEFDTQEPIIPRRPGDFINTWSPDGFLEEAHSPVEGMSLGDLLCRVGK